MALFGGKFQNMFKSASAASKLSGQIASLVERKRALQMSVGNEINCLNAAIQGIFTEIGSATYELYAEKNTEDGDLTEKFEKVTELKKEAAAKVKQFTDIGARYDEEITLLQNLAIQQNYAALAQASYAAADTAAAPAKDGGFFTPYGAPYSKNKNTFCPNCGNKLL